MKPNDTAWVKIIDGMNHQNKPLIKKTKAIIIKEDSPYTYTIKAIIKERKYHMVHKKFIYQLNSPKMKKLKEIKKLP